MLNLRWPHYSMSEETHMLKSNKTTQAISIAGGGKVEVQKKFEIMDNWIFPSFPAHYKTKPSYIFLVR